MTFSYTGDPSKSDADKVRFDIGDTDSAEYFLEDEEIAAIISDVVDVGVASARAVEHIIAKLARRVDSGSGKTRTSFSQQLEHYERLKKTLAQRAALTARVYSGGQSQAEKDAEAEDDDAIQPVFSRGMHDNPNASTT